MNSLPEVCCALKRSVFYLGTNKERTPNLTFDSSGVFFLLQRKYWIRNSFNFLCCFSSSNHTDYWNKNIFWRRKLFLDASQDSLDQGQLLTAVSFWNWNVFWRKKTTPLDILLTELVFTEEFSCVEAIHTFCHVWDWNGSKIFNFNCPLHPGIFFWVCACWGWVGREVHANFFF